MRSMSNASPPVPVRRGHLPDPTCAEDVLFEWLRGYTLSAVLVGITRLAIPDALSSGPKTLDELVERSKVHRLSLLRVLRVCVGAGIVAQHPDGRYGLTD